VMDELAEIDDVAYIRFASIYREFKDMSSFMKTMEDMIAKREKES
ncbi:transcriptional regulator NrdR, partial [Lactobacillus sp. XV13L]|nr:transcriptional regulator NrdR [Lactobacillus sp. XV13L]